MYMAKIPLVNVSVVEMGKHDNTYAKEEFCIHIVQGKFTLCLYQDCWS